MRHAKRAYLKIPCADNSAFPSIPNHELLNRGNCQNHLKAQRTATHKQLVTINMNTNTPSNDASPTNTTNTNAHNTPTTPNRTNIVSQSQGSGGIEALIEATVRTSNGVFTPIVERQLDNLEAHLYDDNLHSQVPADAIARTDTGVMPETRSPLKRDLFVNFENARKTRKGDGVALRQKETHMWL